MQTRDVRVRELREDAALAPEALFADAADEPRIEELDGDAAFVAPVVAAREPHAPHAAAPERRFEGVRPDA